MTDTATAVFRINGTLQGPVVDILGQFLPELKALPREQAYDRTLDDLNLLSRCFQIFRKERPRFRYVLVDERRRPVSEDNVPLSCGRTLAEVIAMVVRTAAKRYFRRKLAPAAIRVETETRAEAVETRAHAAARSPADELYDAIKAYLLHEWQVPLVPAYSEMDPTLVRRVGAKILDCREADTLARLIADPDAPVQPISDDVSPPVAASPTTFAVPFVSPFAPLAKAPLAPVAPVAHHSTAKLDDVLTPDHQRLRAEAFTQTLLDPEVRAVLPNADQIVRIGDVLRGVGGQPAAALVDGLGLRKDQLAVMLMVAHDSIGSTVFGRLFGPRADPELVGRIVERARLRGIGPTSEVIECAIFMRGVFARFGHRARRD
ncbi:hypothetical protein CCC_03049 [Paramagnetospirillum magnetotacticum MS-1]|uniref:Uncharacterized protein n=1 Tax=Paramagnetospirillum magnetotacticum MS-1 TaxID=272627 RepID=A0A0C2Z037_PARME|nr:hypothetical protein [Paramagnetospirillum magnetotacticum]KIM00261.1 hypothetical protein CCC_03049 [Paramagnetospirillum magnetotacticum MS-1]